MRTSRRFGIVIDNFRTTIRNSEPQDVKGRISFHVHIRLHGAVSGGEPRRCGLPGQRASDRKSNIRSIITDYLLVGLGSLAVGHFVLTLFGLSLPVIQLGGGLLICRTALQWLSDSDSSVGHAQGKDVNPLHKIALESQVFYPITFPISIGPGSVSVILTLMASVSMKDGWAKGLLSYAIIALVIVLMCLILYLFLSQGERIIRKIGTSGSIVINKMVAFFTFCVGVQIVVTGIAKLFHLHL